MDLNRRHLLTVAGAAALPARARAQAGDTTIRIGVLSDMAGPYRDISGPGGVACVRQAIQDFGDHGFKVEVVAADHQRTRQQQTRHDGRSRGSQAAPMRDPVGAHQVQAARAAAEHVERRTGDGGLEEIGGDPVVLLQYWLITLASHDIPFFLPRSNACPCSSKQRPIRDFRPRCNLLGSFLTFSKTLLISEE